MSSLMLQYSIMKHSKRRQQKWEVMTCKNSIISIKKGYQETMYQTYPMIFTMPEMDQYQRKHSIHDQIWQLLKYV